MRITFIPFLALSVRSFSLNMPQLRHPNSSPTSSPSLLHMVPEDVKEVLEHLYQGPTQVCVSVSGGGGALSGWMVGTPGCSSCLLDLKVLYARAAAVDFVDPDEMERPFVGSFCSAEFSGKMARSAHLEAARLAVLEWQEQEMASEGLQMPLTLGPLLALAGQTHLVGLGITAGLVSTRPKRGDHRCHVSTYCAHRGLVTYSLTLDKGARDRAEEDAMVARLAVYALAEAAGVPVPKDFLRSSLTDIEVEPQPIANVGMTPSGSASSDAGDAPPVGLGPEAVKRAVEDVLSNRSPLALLVPTTGGEWLVYSGAAAGKLLLPRPTLIVPGSFNPLHVGHVELALAARKAWMKEQKQTYLEIISNGHPRASMSPPPIVFELAVQNPDKGSLDPDQVMERLENFASPASPTGEEVNPEVKGLLTEGLAVAVTSCSLFSQKSEVFPGAAFVVGSDTAKRIIDPKYYQDSEVEMAAALALLGSKGCSFVVGGREEEGRFVTWSDVISENTVALPKPVSSLFINVPEQDFRNDISSTAIRAARR